MLDILSPPSDQSDFKIRWPWNPFSTCPQANESFSVETYKERTPLVAKIAKIYETPLGEDDRERHFTNWQNGLFFSLTPAALRAIVPFPAVVKALGDNAKPLGELFVYGLVRSDSASEISSGMSPEVSSKIQRKLDRRDNKRCVVLDTEDNVRYTRIVPFQAICLDKKAFESITAATQLYFHQSFRSYLHSNLRSLRHSENHRWNFLSLSPYIAEMFQKGLVGFKPLYTSIDWSVDPSWPVDRYFAVCSFHWLERDQSHPVAQYRKSFSRRGSEGSGVESDNGELAADTTAKKDCICVSDAGDCRIEEGKVIKIPYNTKVGAERMLSVLALRWAVGSMWYLAGAAGIGPDDSLADESDEHKQPLQNDCDAAVASLVKHMRI